jgi:NNP family nitrate/nitrite transporter-like MFS transporter
MPYTLGTMIRRHLTLSTLSFTLCFAMWGLVGAFGPVFRQTFALSGTQAALLVAVPVLLGSLARVPAGMLTDRFGGRAVFTALMGLVAIAAAVVPRTSGYDELLAAAFFLGLAGSSFAVGVGYVSGWTTPERQGARLAFTVLVRLANPPPCSLDLWLPNASAGKTFSILGPVYF